jgi:hypothetical protein
MQAVDETLVLLKRQAVLEAAMKQRGGIRVTEERELHVVRQRLDDFPDAMRTVVQAARALRRSITELSASDVQLWANNSQLA